MKPTNYTPEEHADYEGVAILCPWPSASFDYDFVF